MKEVDICLSLSKKLKKCFLPGILLGPIILLLFTAIVKIVPVMASTHLANASEKWYKQFQESV